MKKTLAIPAHLLGEYLNDAQRDELKKYGDQPLDDNEIAERALDEERDAAKEVLREREKKIKNIKASLEAIDAKSIRAIREGDVSRLTELTAQAVALRQELSEIA